MLAQNRLGACLPTFGSCADRYCLSGYGGGGSTMEEMLDLAAQVEELDGLEIVGNWHVNDDTVDRVKQLFAERGLAISMVVPDLWTQAKWGRGSLAAADAATRRAAVAEVKKSMDWAAGVGCAYVDVWPGQDGYDYPLEAEYQDAWRWLRDGLQECAAHRDDVKVLVEYKLKEPRTHCYVNSAAKTILLLDGLDNVGGLLDIGHSMAAGENVAEAAALLAQFGRLDYLHLNDNYRSWDDDMMFAAVNVPEALELVYWLRQLNYTGWLTLDVFPYREEKLPVVRNCFAWLHVLSDAIDRVGVEAIHEVVRANDGNASVALVRRLLTGG